MADKTTTEKVADKAPDKGTEKAVNTTEKHADKKKAAEGDGETPQHLLHKEKKASRWTLALCQKFARRFDSREAWEAGAPASFKAATARGWQKECFAVLQKPTAKLKAAKPAKDTAMKKPVKKLPRAS